MKKILSLLLVFVFLVITVGCSRTPGGDILPPPRVGKTGTPPPTRVGSAKMKVYLEAYTMESATAAADVVARVEVGSWIGEETDLYKTYYEATALQCFKGNIPASFTLLQYGNSKCTVKGYPLFTSGNEMLLFLKEATGVNYESAYWIIGEFSTVMDVSYDDAGNRYYADRYGILGKTVNIAANYARQRDTFKEVYARAAEADPIVREMKYPYPYVFAENDISSLFRNR